MNTQLINEKEFNSFRQFIYEQAGISISASKQSLVSGRLNKRLTVTGSKNFAEYHAFISSANDGALAEKQIAIDLLTTNETFFFREIRHFDFLRKEFLPKFNTGKLRVWSAASSSGEEAYSIAMCLASQSKVDWEVVGTDISSRVIESASRARYPLADAQKIPGDYLREYCLKGTGDQSGNLLISKPLRQKVKFLRANLQHNQSALGMFNIIFLRNVMIYFDKDTKVNVLANVVRQLKPGGLLMIGHAESLQGITPPELSLVQTAIYQKLI